MKDLTTTLTKNIKQLLIHARNKIVQSVNTTMVYTYFKIGKIIVEDEQKGKERAEYGKKVLKQLSTKLVKEFGKGFSERNLKNMRKFYLVYSKSQTLSSQSLNTKDIALKTETNNLSLSWSNYVFLVRLNERERSFYEKEAIINNWSLRELQRHFDSSLFDRVLLSSK